MADLTYTVFPTAFGPMGAVADGGELVRVELPHYQLDDLEALLAFEHQGALRDDDAFQAFRQRCRDYFNAKPVNFDDIACKLPKETTFTGMVLRACRAIPHGQTMSYSGLAKQIDRPDAARAVAAAMGKNPLPLVIPCHRVTYAGGKIGGFSAPGGEILKQRMQDLEAKARP